jgi:capsular exopolysaccharide synthesis family protein
MEIRKYFALFRHWLWLIVVCAVVAGTLSYFYSRSQPKLYRATAKFQLVVATADGNSLYVGQIVASNLVQDYLQLIPTREVAEAALAELVAVYPGIVEDGWRASDVLNSISVSSPLDSQIIVISAVDVNPDRAADIANIVGRVFAERQEKIQGQNYDSVIAILDEQIAASEVELAAINEQLETLGEDLTPTQQLEFDRLGRQRQVLQNGINAAANQRVDEQRVRASTINRFISADSAVGPENAFSPRTTTNTVLAAIVGAMLAVGVVALIDYLDDTVKSADEILASTGLSTLASISFIKGESAAERLITHIQPRSPISEAFRVLRTNLSFAAIDSGLKSVLVTSSTPSEGKSTSSANIATAMAQTGLTVVLIDGDLRRPTQHKVFQLSNNHGLTTALLDAETPVSEHLQPTMIQGLKLLASGPLPPNPAELLNSQRMTDVIESLQKLVDVVVIDTPPVLTVADAAILAPKVSGCVLVAQLGKTRQDMLSEAADRLRASGASVFGIVLNRTNSGRNKYYEYYNEQYYTGDYASKPTPSSAGGIFARFSRSTGD